MKKLHTKVLFLALIMMISQLQANKPVQVIISKVEQKFYSDTIEALGTLRANESVVLKATVTERINTIHFEGGQRVKKGDVLVEMDIFEELALMQEQKAILKDAQLQVRRLAPLAVKGAASKSDLDANRLNVSTTQARIEAIQANINERRILAPFDGVVGLRNISVGTLARFDTDITTIDDDSVMKLDFSVPSLYLSSLKPGMPLKVKSAVFPDRNFTATLSAIDNQIDPITRNIIVRARIDNSEYTLKPGLLMQVFLEANPRKRLLIPEAALIPNGYKTFVLVVQEKEGKKSVEKRRVNIGERHTGVVEVLSGLNADELVVTQGTMKAKPGKAIEIRAVQKGDESLPELLEQKMEHPKKSQP